MKMPPIDKKKLTAISIAVVMGIIALSLVNKYTEQRIVDSVAEIARKQQQQLAATQGLYDAVVAVREINPGQVIDRNMVSIKKIPGEYMQPGAVTSVDALVGKTARVDILPGEQVTASKLARSGSLVGPTSSLSLKIPTGMRAITVPIDALSAAGGMVRPGDYVDIIGNFAVPQQIDGKMSAQLATVTLFQNVLIIGVDGQFSAPASAGGRGGAGEAPVAGGGVLNITFAMPPKEAELLLFALEQGRLKLIVRPALDTATHAIPVATWALLQQYILASQGLQPAEDTVNLPEQQALQNRIIEIYKAGVLEKEGKE